MRPLISLLLFVACCHAETVVFNAGDGSFEIQFVPISDPGNPDDTRQEYVVGPERNQFVDPYHIGGVDYEYSIAKFELSCESVRIADDLGVFASPLGTSLCSDDAVRDKPVDLDPPRVIEFFNWLNAISGYQPAYAKSNNTGRLGKWQPDDPGYNPQNPTRNAGARFFMANADEFHKAAYFDPVSEVWLDYPTGSNKRPIAVVEGVEPGTAVVDGVRQDLFDLADVDRAGGLSAYGTMGQIGNVEEWEEEFGWKRAGVLERGDTSFASRSRIRNNTGATAGLRIVAVTPVPEPSSLTLLAFALCSRRAFRRRYWDGSMHFFRSGSCSNA